MAKWLKMVKKETILTFFHRFQTLKGIKIAVSYGNFAEWVDLAYWWSCIRKGLRLLPAQQDCFYLFLHVLCRPFSIFQRYITNHSLLGSPCVPFLVLFSFSFIYKPTIYWYIKWYVWDQIFLWEHFRFKDPKGDCEIFCLTFLNYGILIRIYHLRGLGLMWDCEPPLTYNVFLPAGGQLYISIPPSVFQRSGARGLGPEVCGHFRRSASAPGWSRQGESDNLIVTIWLSGWGL